MQTSTKNTLNHSTAANLINCKISNLQVVQTNVKLTGIIITKQEPREVVSKKTSTAKVSYVLSFTLRDSEIDFINVSVWGTENYILLLNDELTIGCIVEIKRPVIRLKMSSNKSHDFDDLYRPWTPSQYELILNEQTSSVDLAKLDGNSLEFDYDNLFSLPIREHSDYFKLQDVIINGTVIDQQHINLLFAIKKINEVQEVRTKHDKLIPKLDMIIFDDTYAAFKLTIWDRELIKYALLWTPKSQVIFAVDVKVSYDNYNKTMVATASSKTIFISNPTTDQGFRLYNYAKNTNIDIDYNLNAQFDELEHDSVKYKIRDLNESIQKDTLNDDYISIDALVTQFDLDSDPGKFILTKCAECESIVNTETKMCQKAECSLFRKMTENFKLAFDVQVNLSDETGTLNRVKIASKCVERIMGVKPKDFLALNQSEITAQKWKLLLERWKLILKATLNPNYEKNELQSSIYLRVIQIHPIS